MLKEYLVVNRFTVFGRLAGWWGNPNVKIRQQKLDRNRRIRKHQEITEKVQTKVNYKANQK